MKRIAVIKSCVIEYAHPNISPEELKTMLRSIERLLPYVGGVAETDPVFFLYGSGDAFCSIWRNTLGRLLEFMRGTMERRGDSLYYEKKKICPAAYIDTIDMLLRVAEPGVDHIYISLT